MAADGNRTADGDGKNDKPLDIELRSSNVVCAGSATAHVCRVIAHRAGAYAPGISEFVFSSLNQRFYGSSIEGVEHWFRSAGADLYAHGYRLSARRIAFRTPMITKWVAAGDGFRGAVLTTDGTRFHNGRVGPDDDAHAVGLVLAAGAKKKKSGLQLVDPWPNVEHKRAPDKDILEKAHRDRKYGTVVIYWSGHS